MKAHNHAESARETVAENGSNAFRRFTLAYFSRLLGASQHISQRDFSAQGHLVKVERQSVRNFLSPSPPPVAARAAPVPGLDRRLYSVLLCISFCIQLNFEIAC